MLVYRIETTERGHGPYVIGNLTKGRTKLRDKIIKAHSRDNYHPSVRDIDGFNYKYYCGFTSPSKLEDWFKGYVGKLFRCKYVLNIYDVPAEDVIEDEYQCAFVFDRAKIVDTIKNKRSLKQYEEPAFAKA